MVTIRLPLTGLGSWRLAVCGQPTASPATIKSPSTASFKPVIHP